MYLKGLTIDYDLQYNISTILKKKNLLSSLFREKYVKFEFQITTINNINNNTEFQSESFFEYESFIVSFKCRIINTTLDNTPEQV